MNRQDRAFLIRWIKNGLLLGTEGLLAGTAGAFIACLYRLAQDIGWPWMLEWLPALSWPMHLAFTAVLAWTIGRLIMAAPLIAGSGIPQAELIIEGKIRCTSRQWRALLGGKFFGCLLASLGGLSLGREGPCIFLGSAAAGTLDKLWRRLSPEPARVIAAGAAAGLTAAFSAPVASFLFVFEEMRLSRRPANMGAVAVATAAAWLVTRHGFGLSRIFPFQDLPAPPWQQLWLCLPLGCLTGIAGVLFARMLIAAKNWEAAHTPLPQSWRVLPALLVAWAMMLLLPQMSGGGETLIQTFHESLPALDVALLFFVVKLLFSCISCTGNAPGGLLMPSLCLGALTGIIGGKLFLSVGWTDPAILESVMLLGMAGIFASLVRAPLTGVALMAELTGNWECLPAAALVAAIATVTANALRCPPIYDTLRDTVVIPENQMTADDTPHANARQTNRTTP